MINKSVSDVRITSLKSGSVLVAGNIDSKNTKDERDTISILSSGLTSGAIIANQ